MNSPDPRPLSTKLTAPARSKLRAALRSHPQAGEHVETLSEISTMTKRKLFELADRLGVDVARVVAAGPARARVNKDAAFFGSFDFDLEITLLGRRIKRAARMVYEYSPEWEHYHLGTKSLMPPEGAWVTHIEVLAVPAIEYHERGPGGRWRKGVPKPGWVQVSLNQEGVLTSEMEEALEDAIDKKCRQEDRARRKAAGLKAS